MKIIRYVVMLLFCCSGFACTEDPIYTEDDDEPIIIGDPTNSTTESDSTMTI